MTIHSILASTNARLATLGIGLTAALATLPALAQAQVIWVQPVCRTVIVGYDMFGYAIVRTVCGY